MVELRDKGTLFTLLSIVERQQIGFLKLLISKFSEVGDIYQLIQAVVDKENILIQCADGGDLCFAGSMQA